MSGEGTVESGAISPMLTASLVYDDAREGIRWLVGTH